MNVIRVMTVLLSTGVLHYMRTSVPSKAVFLLSFLHIPKTSLSGPLLRSKGEEYMGIHVKFTKRAEIGRPSPKCTVHVCTYVQKENTTLVFLAVWLVMISSSSNLLGIDTR